MQKALWTTERRALVISLSVRRNKMHCVHDQNGESSTLVKKKPHEMQCVHLTDKMSASIFLEQIRNGVKSEEKKADALK